MGLSFFESPTRTNWSSWRTPYSSALRNHQSISFLNASQVIYQSFSSSITVIFRKSQLVLLNFFVYSQGHHYSLHRATHHKAFRKVWFPETKYRQRKSTLWPTSLQEPYSEVFLHSELNTYDGECSKACVWVFSEQFGGTQVNHVEITFSIHYCVLRF